MSHFTVMIFGLDPEQQLARYDESIDVPEYCRGEVSDEEKESMLQYYNTKEGCSFDSFDTCYESKGDDWNENRWRKDATDGKWKEYSTYNPYSKWDWYELGGRWSGLLKLKPGKNGVQGQPGVFGNVPGIDQALKKDIDFEGMMTVAREKAIHQYKGVAELFGGSIPKLSIAAPNRRKDLSDDADYKALWDEYNSQECVRVFREKVSENLSGYDIDDFQCTEEEFVQDKENQAVSTFAYVLNGEWFQRGQMGWFGCVGNETMTKTEWHKHMREVIEAMPDDTLISIYDCHI